MKNIIMSIALLFVFISCTSKSGENLIKAVKANDFEEVKKIVTSENVNSTDETGATPAMWAAYNGNVKILDFLVKKGADVRKKGIIGINTENAPETYTNTLEAAAGKGNLETVKYLIEKAGVSPDERGDCLNHFMVLPKDLKTIEGLVKFIRSSHGRIFDLIKEHEQYENFVNATDEILPYYFLWIIGDLINSKDLINAIPDEYAFRRISNNRKELDNVLDEFLKPLENYNFVRRANMTTPLSKASFHGNVEIISYLISKGADINFRDCYDLFPLMSAAIAKKYSAIEILMKNNAKKYVVKHPMGDRVSVLSQLMVGYFQEQDKAEFKKNIANLLPLLWQNEQDIIESVTDVYPHPLLEPCLAKDADFVKIFMENGADYSKIKNNGRPLKEICAADGIEIKDEWLKKRE